MNLKGVNIIPISSMLLTAMLLICYYCTLKNDGLASGMALSGNYSTAISHPWTLASYMLIHVSPLHLIMNVIFLITTIAILKLSWKEIAATYFMGGIIGAVSFILLNRLFDVPDAILAGSSAAIFTMAGYGVCRINKKYLILPALLVLMSFYASNLMGGLLHIIGLSAGIVFSVFNGKKLEKTNKMVEKIQTSGYLSLSETEKNSLFVKRSR